MFYGEKTLLDIHRRYLTDEPFLVGGVPRDIFLGRDKDFKDFDITTNSSDALRLGILFAGEIKKNFLMFKEGNLKVLLDDNSIDFSSNFVSERVIDYVRKELSINDEKMFEAYSRDFTINTMQKSLESEEVIDVIGTAKDDLNSKIIKTVVPAQITLADDPRRCIRAINFSARYGFDIDNDIVKFVSDNKEELFSGSSNIKDAFVISKISESIYHDADRTFYYIDKMKILEYIPLEGDFRDEVIRRKLVLKYLDG